MFGNNSFWDRLKGKWGIALGVVLAMAVACGIVVPNVQLGDRIDANEAGIGELNTWRVEFYDVEWPAHLKVFGDLADDVGANLKAFTDYTTLNDKAVKDLDAAIKVIDTWMHTFYSDKEGALGEWQVFMAVWSDFYNKDYGPTGIPLGEFQRTINSIYDYYAGWATAFNARLTALEE